MKERVELLITLQQAFSLETLTTLDRLQYLPQRNLGEIGVSN